MRSDTVASDIQARSAVSVFGKVFHSDSYTSILARWPAACFLFVFTTLLFTVVGLSSSSDTDNRLLAPNRFDAINTLAAKLEARGRLVDEYASQSLQLLDKVGANAALHPPLGSSGYAVQRFTLLFRINWDRAAQAGIIPQQRHFFAHHTIRYVALLEMAISSLAEYQMACWRTDLQQGKINAVDVCAPVNSITQYFFPGRRVDDAGTGGTYFPFTAGPAATATTVVQQLNVKGLVERIFKNPRWQWYFDRSFSKSNRTAPQTIKSQFVLGAAKPWPTGSDADINTAGSPASATVLENVRAIDIFLRKAYTVILSQTVLPDWIDVYFHNERLERLLIQDEMSSSVSWRIIVCIVVCIAVIWLKTKSFTLATFGTVQVWFTYALVQFIAADLNTQSESVLAVLYLFAVAVLSLNGLFVYIDTFNHSGVMITHGNTNALSVEQRMSWTFRKVMRGAIVSHLVVIIVSALLLGMSPVPAVSDSGAIGIIMALVDLMFWVTYTPSLLLFHHFYLSKRRRLLQRRRDVMWQRGNSSRDPAAMAVLDAVQLSRDLRGEKILRQIIINDPDGVDLIMMLNNNDNSGDGSGAAPHVPAAAAEATSPFASLVDQLKSAFKQFRSDVRSLSEHSDERLAAMRESGARNNSPSGFDLREAERRRQQSQDGSSQFCTSHPTTNNQQQQHQRQQRLSRGSHPLAPFRRDAAEFSEGEEDASTPRQRHLHQQLPQALQQQSQQQQQQQQQHSMDSGTMSPAEGDGSVSAPQFQQQGQQQQQQEPEQQSTATPRLLGERRKSKNGDNDDDGQENDGEKKQGGGVDGAGGFGFLEGNNGPSDTETDSSITGRADKKGKRIMSDGAKDDDDDDDDDDDGGENTDPDGAGAESSAAAAAAASAAAPVRKIASAGATKAATKEKEEEEEEIDSHHQRQRKSRRLSSSVPDDGELQLEEVHATHADFEAEARRREEKRLKDISDVRGLGVVPEKHKDDGAGAATKLTVLAGGVEEAVPVESAAAGGKKRRFLLNKRNNNNGDDDGHDDGEAAFVASALGRSPNAFGFAQTGGKSGAGAVNFASTHTDEYLSHPVTTQLGAPEPGFNNSNSYGAGSAAGKIETAEQFLEQFQEIPSEGLFSNKSGEYFNPRRMVQPRHILHVPPALCYRSSQARAAVVRLLAHGMEVDPEDEISGLDANATPIVPPMFAPVPEGATDDQVRADIAESCQDAKAFLERWTKSAARLSITSSENLKMQKERLLRLKKKQQQQQQQFVGGANPAAASPAESTADSGVSAPVPDEDREPNAVQRAVAALFTVHQQCVQPAGSSCTEFVYMAPVPVERRVQRAVRETVRNAKELRAAQQQQQQQNSGVTTSLFEDETNSGSELQRVVPKGVGQDEEERRGGVSFSAIAPTFGVPFSAPAPTFVPVDVAAASGQDGTPQRSQQQQQQQEHKHELSPATKRLLRAVNESEHDECCLCCFYGADTCSACNDACSAAGRNCMSRIRMEGPPRRFWWCGPRTNETAAERDRRLLLKAQHIDIKIGMLENYLLRYFDNILVPQRYLIMIVLLVVFILSSVGTARLAGTSRRFQHLSDFPHNGEFLELEAGKQHDPKLSSRRNMAKPYAMYNDYRVACDTCSPYFRDTNEIFPSSPLVESVCGKTAATAHANLYVDRCGVCSGKGKCVDCAGVPHGNATIDRCGVCLVANSSSRDACLAAPASSSNRCTGNDCTFCEAHNGPAYRNMGGPNCDRLCDENTNCVHGTCNRLTGVCECFRNGSSFLFPHVAWSNGATVNSSSSPSSQREGVLIFTLDGLTGMHVPSRRLLGGYYDGDTCAACALRTDQQVAPLAFSTDNELLGACYSPCLSAMQDPTAAPCSTLAMCTTGRAGVSGKAGGVSCGLSMADVCDRGTWSASRGTCQCTDGWVGPRCDRTLFCKGRGRHGAQFVGDSKLSRLLDSDQFCLCDGMWTGKDCGMCSCKNGGWCDPALGGQCRCLGAWSGRDCGVCAASCVERGTACPTPWDNKHYIRNKDLVNANAIFSNRDPELAYAGVCEAVLCTELQRLQTGSCPACLNSNAELTATPSTACTAPCSGNWGGLSCESCYDASMRCVTDGTGKVQACDGNYYSNAKLAPRQDSCGKCVQPSDPLTAKQFHQMRIATIDAKTLIDTAAAIAFNRVFDEYRMLLRCEQEQPAETPNDDTDLFLYIGVIHPVTKTRLSIKPDNTVAAISAFSTAVGALDLNFNMSDSRVQGVLSVLCDRLRTHQVGVSAFSYMPENCSAMDLMWYLAGTPEVARKGFYPPQNSSADRFASRFIIDTQAVQGQIGMMLNPDFVDTLKHPTRSTAASSSSASSTPYDRRVAFLRMRLALPNTTLSTLDVDNAAGLIRTFDTLTWSMEAVLNVSAMFVCRRWTELQQSDQGPRTLKWILALGFISVIALTNISQRSFMAAFVALVSVATAALCTFALVRARGLDLGSIEIFLMPALFAISCTHSLHMMEAYQEVLQTSQSNLFATELSRIAAAKEALARSGPALVTSSFVILLVCAIFSTSNLVPLSSAASFCALAVFVSSVVAVVFVPALLCVAGPETYYGPRLSFVLLLVYGLLTCIVVVIIAATGGLSTPKGDRAPTFK